jgi:transcriptional regulator with XRE-family HTH domain
MSPEAIAEHARAIRLSFRALGELAGCAENTVNRTLTRATRPLQDTALAIENALVAEEVRLRDYLLELHPVEADRAVSEAAE